MCLFLLVLNAHWCTATPNLRTSFLNYIVGERDDKYDSHVQYFSPAMWTQKCF